MKRVLITTLITWLIIGQNSASTNTKYPEKEFLGTVIIFYSYECPICLKSTNDIKQLINKYHSSPINFKFIYYNAFSSKSKIFSFHKEFKLPTKNIFMDKDNTLVKQFNAQTTPQYFLVDSINNVLYSGKLNNRFENIGIQRSVVTENYLEDAINSFLTGSEISIKTTTPVGCIINK